MLDVAHDMTVDRLAAGDRVSAPRWYQRAGRSAMRSSTPP